MTLFGSHRMALAVAALIFGFWEFIALGRPSSCCPSSGWTT